MARPQNESRRITVQNARARGRPTLADGAYSRERLPLSLHLPARTAAAGLWWRAAFGCGSALWLLAVSCGCRPGGGDPPPRGGELFASYCAPCHGAEGTGVEWAGPPLVDSPWVAGPPERLIRIVLHGIGGPLEIEGRSYELEMPGFGLVLSDEDIAALLSYVRARFAGRARAVSPGEVGRVRAQTEERTGYWTVEELLRVR